MSKKLLLVVTILLAAIISVGSFAYTATTGTTDISVGTLGSGGAFASTTAAGVDGKHTLAPVWHPSVDAASQIPADLNGDADTTDAEDNRAGDLYIVETGTYVGDVLVTLYVNNPADLVKGYTYLTLAIVVYEWDSTAGAWNTTAVAGKTGDNYDTYLTLTNGYVSFVLSQSANGGKYSIGIDAGSFYCINSTAEYISPDFYIDVRQI